MFPFILWAYFFNVCGRFTTPFLYNFLVVLLAYISNNSLFSRQDIFEDINEIMILLLCVGVLSSIIIGHRVPTLLKNEMNFYLYTISVFTDIGSPILSPIKEDYRQCTLNPLPKGIAAE